jgi:ankyrin repeat protein
MIAASKGHLAAVTKLLEGGASREAALSSGATALTLAQARGHAAIVHLLSAWLG